MTKDCKAVFADIYARKVWGDGSGGGSAPDVARPYIDYVNRVLGRSSGVILDIGFGDRMISSEFWLNGWFYIGVDAMPSADGKDIVELRYRGAGTIGVAEPICARLHYNFDALTDPLPDADLVLCKEVLQHLSNEQVQRLLDRTAHYRRRLFTNSTFATDETAVNMDIETGGFRPVDLTLPPFSLPCRTVLKYGCWITQEPI